MVERTPVPSPVTGYALAPGASSGLFSFVLVDRANQVVNLNDIGCYVLAYRGGGLPQVRNLTNLVATTGKTQTIKTLVSEQQLELTIAVMVDNATGTDTLTALQRVLTTLALYLAPSESRQTAANLYIRYQSRGDDCQTRGVALQRLFRYVGGLDQYTIDNREQLRLTLQFESYEGSKWEETSNTTVNFGAAGSNSDTLLTLDLTTGAVAAATGSMASIDLPQRVFKDAAGNLWAGGAVLAGTSSIKGSVIYAGAEAGGGYVGSFAERIPGVSVNVLYAAKVSPDTSTSYLLKLATGDVAWSALAGVNNSIYDMAATANGAEVLIAGSFTTPDTRLAKIDRTGALASLGSATDANSTVYSVSNIASSKFVVAGAFTLLGATTVGRIGIIDIADGSLISTLGGGLSETIYAVKALPTGEIYALGQLKVYYWNGSKWTSTVIVGQNTTATTSVTAVNNCFGYDKTTGAVYFCARGIGTVSADNHHVRQVLRGVMGTPVGIQNSDATGVLIKKTAVVFDSIMYISSSTGSGIKAAPVTITYTGTNDQPRLTFAFTTNSTNSTVERVIGDVSSVFIQVKNWSTGKAIMIDLPQGIIRRVENLVIDLNQDGRPVAFYVPDASGNIQEDLTRYILPGSDTDTFALVRGTNYIEVWGTAGNGSIFDAATLTYQNAHYGADGSVNQTVVTVA